jgi:hypothetical protein
MAEVASLILAIGGGIDVASRTSFGIARLIREWRDAPVQIAYLSEEFENSRHTMLQLKAFLKDTDVNAVEAVYVVAIGSLLRRAEPLWFKLDKIFESLVKSTDRRRKARWIRSAQNVASIQEQLRALRFGILEILSILTA